MKILSSSVWTRAKKDAFHSKIILTYHTEINPATMITAAINNNRNNNGIDLGQLSTHHLALGALLVFVHNISPSRTAGLLVGCSKSLLRCRNPAAHDCDGTGTRSVLLMRGDLRWGGGGGKDALGKGQGHPLKLGLLCSVWNEAEPVNKKSRKEQYTRLQRWGKGELQRGRDFDM